MTTVSDARPRSSSWPATIAEAAKVVSPGHRIDVRAAVRRVLACSRFRVPEPIRQAEQVANRVRAAGAIATGWRQA